MNLFRNGPIPASRHGLANMGLANMGLANMGDIALNHSSNTQRRIATG
jgi:hypothetical protein